MAIFAALVFTPALVTRGHKRYDQKQLMELNVAYGDITSRYWGYSLLMILPISLAILVGWIIAARFPSIELHLRFFSGIVAIATIPVYQSIFAMVTNVYPTSRNQDYVTADRETVRLLAWRGIGAVLALVGVAFFCAVLLPNS